MPQILIKIDSERLDFAIGLMEGAALAKPALTDDAIEKQLTKFKFTEIEIMIAKQEHKKRLAEIVNWADKPKAKTGRKPKEESETKAEVQTDLEVEDDESFDTESPNYRTKDDGNVLGV